MKFDLIKITLMKLTIVIDAQQLTEGDETFMGQEVRGESTNRFVMIPYQNSSVKISEGDWAVTYDDGTLEIWKDADIEHKTKIVPDGHTHTTEEEKAELEKAELEKLPEQKNKSKK